MNEAKLTTELRKWIDHRLGGSAAIEVKKCPNGSLPFSALKDHQADALKKAKHGGLSYKIPDDARGRKPFDLMVYEGVPAYVCVFFYSYGDKQFYLIDIDDWEEMVETVDRKSVTEMIAAEYSSLSDQL